MLKGANLLEKIVETIDTYGNKKRSYGNTEDGFCLFGALYHVNGLLDGFGDVYQEMKGTMATADSTLMEAMWMSPADIISLNDCNDWECVRDVVLTRAKELSGGDDT